MAKCIKIEKDDKTYTLEFDRSSVVATEEMGFRATEVGDLPMKNGIILIKGSLIKHHKGMNKNEVDSLIDFMFEEYGLPDTVAALLEIYEEVFHMEGRKGKTLVALIAKQAPITAVK